MAPLYNEGNYCLCKRAKAKNLKPGDVVVSELPIYGKIIKRIKSIDKDLGLVELTGENPESITTEQMGLIPLKNILWQVIWPRKSGKPSS